MKGPYVVTWVYSGRPVVLRSGAYDSAPMTFTSQRAARAHMNTFLGGKANPLNITKKAIVPLAQYLVEYGV